MSEPDRKLALVTGGSFGIGLALSRHLLAEGYDVLACSRTQARLDEAQNTLTDMRVIRTDITKDEHLDRLFEEVLTIGKPLDMLVNNAGVSFVCDYTNDVTLERNLARDEIEINFAAPVEIIRRFLWMRRQQGWEDRPATIVNVGTPGSLFPLETNALYSATKSAFHMFTMSLRRQLAATPVTVAEVYPPLLDTGLSNDQFIAGKERYGAEAIDKFARFTVDGILAGEPDIYPPAITFVSKMLEITQAEADKINPHIKRVEGWETSARQRQGS